MPMPGRYMREGMMCLRQVNIQTLLEIDKHLNNAVFVSSISDKKKR